MKKYLVVFLVLLFAVSSFANNLSERQLRSHRSSGNILIIAGIASIGAGVPFFALGDELGIIAGSCLAGTGAVLTISGISISSRAGRELRRRGLAKAVPDEILVFPNGVNFAWNF